MSKRAYLLAIPWLYFAWYGWSMHAGLQGLDPRWGPVIALSGLAAVLAFRVRSQWAAMTPALPAAPAQAQQAEPA